MGFWRLVHLEDKLGEMLCRRMPLSLGPTRETALPSSLGHRLKPTVGRDFRLGFPSLSHVRISVENWSLEKRMTLRLPWTRCRPNTAIEFLSLF